MVDTTVVMIESMFRMLDDHLTCFDCKRSLRERVKDIVIEWSEQKVRRHLYSSVFSHITLSPVTANDLADRSSVR